MIFRVWKLFCCGGMCLFFFIKLYVWCIYYNFLSLMKNLLIFEWERDDFVYVEIIMLFFVLSINEFLFDS